MGNQKKKAPKRGAAEELAAYFDSFPEWYWKFGLHDAKILSVSDFTLWQDCKSAVQRRNCLEICLDSSDTREAGIFKIKLYQFKILSPTEKIADLEGTWWLGDKLTRLPDHRFALTVYAETKKGDQLELAVEFETAEVERKG